MVRQFVMGMVPEVRPRAEPGVVLGRGRRATRGRAPARGVGEASRGRETSRGTRRRRESTSSERGASRGATPSAGAAEVYIGLAFPFYLIVHAFHCILTSFAACVGSVRLWEC